MILDNVGGMWYWVVLEVCGTGWCWRSAVLERIGSSGECGKHVALKERSESAL